MIVEGTLDKSYKGSLAGKPYKLDYDLDVFYVQIRQSDAAYSDYIELPDNDVRQGRYIIVDFDRDRRVVGYTFEGLIDDYKRKSVKARIVLDLKLTVFATSFVTTKVIEHLKNQFPPLDSRGRLVYGRSLALA